MKQYNILFLCTHNSARSILGEALASTHPSGLFVGYSAGSTPGTTVNPIAQDLAIEMGKYGIRVNCISPGGIYNNQSEIFVKNYERKVPMNRMGKTSDIAPAVCFMLSDESSYITGQNLVIDGGWTSI
mgnify:CR=1 FL=1